MLLLTRNKDRRDELDSHYEVAKDVDERAREGCPVHLSSQLVTTSRVLHGDWHSKVKIVVDLLLLGVVDSLILAFLFFKELFVECVALKCTPDGDLLLS